jgi:hypothetical protein
MVMVEVKNKLAWARRLKTGWSYRRVVCNSQNSGPLGGNHASKPCCAAREAEIDEGVNGVEEALGDGRRKSSRTELVSHSLLKETRVRLISNHDCYKNLQIWRSVGLLPH